MKFEDAAIAAMDELSRSNPDFAASYLCLMVRICQLRNSAPPDPVRSAAGKARSNSLTPERRSEIARMGAKAKWGKP